MVRDFQSVIGKETRDPSLASHWYTEAANVWVTSLADAHQAARALMNAARSHDKAEDS